MEVGPAIQRSDNAGARLGRNLAWSPGTNCRLSAVEVVKPQRWQRPCVARAIPAIDISIISRQLGHALRPADGLQRNAPTHGLRTLRPRPGVSRLYTALARVHFPSDPEFSNAQRKSGKYKQRQGG